MEVHEIMTRSVEFVHPETTLQEAAERMRLHDLGFLPVCDRERVLGVVTDRDITVRATAAGRDSEITAVREVMTDDAVFLNEDDDVRSEARLMRERQVRRLLVLDHAHRLVGVVSLGDLASAAHDGEMVGHTLEGVTEPSWAPET